jgi:Acetyltransferase (GNAT) family.
MGAAEYGVLVDDLRTRAISLRDAGEILVLQRAAYATEAQIYADPFLPALTQSLDELENELRSGGGLIATLGERIVAAVRWTVHGDTVHIGRLTVAPDQQGKGLGTRLLRQAEHDSGATSAELFTGHLSAANIKLYVREGYVETRREHLHEGVELVYLAKRLDDGRVS